MLLWRQVVSASLFSPSEWSKAVQRGVGAIGTIGIILGAYFAVDGWADDKISEVERRQIEERAEQQVRNDIAHDKIIQSTRITTSETAITVTEMKLEQLEEEVDERAESGLEPTARQERSMNRLLSLLDTYESEQTDATSKLTRISKTTTVTTTTTTEDDP